MSEGIREIGELSLKTRGVTVEWTLRDVLSYTAEDEGYRSPIFSVPGSQWRLLVCPNVRNKYDSAGWISLYLWRVADSTYPKSVVWSLGVKKADGTVEERLSDVTHVFPNADRGCGDPEFLSRSELERRKSELMPSDALTVTCTLRVDDSLNATSALMNLSQDLKDVYLSRRSSDATLKVKNKDLSVHKAILESRSPVFRSMFELDMKEKNTGVVEIVDCSPEVFQDFLVYLYTGEFQNSSKRDFDLYRVADKYAVEGLKPECVRSMLSNLIISNVLDVVYLARQYDENELKIKAQGFFNENFTEIADTAQWNKLLNSNHKLVNELLKEMALKLKNSK